jgi:hypothetical protein
MSERNLPRLAVDGCIGIGIVGLVDNLDTSHDILRRQNAGSNVRFREIGQYSTELGGSTSIKENG